jgi:hypothetical protein
MTEISDDVRAIHANLHTILARRFPMVDREDISQELWLSYYGSEWAPQGPQKPVDAPEGGSEWDDYSRHIRALRREMEAAAKKWCRAEKAAAEGYDPDDEAYYSIGALKILLEAWFVHGPVEAPPRTAESSVSRPKGSGQYGDYLVSLIDVGAAVRRLPAKHKRFLWYGYSPQYAGRTDDETASELRSGGWQGMNTTMLAQRIRRALEALQNQLGGRR